MNILIDYSIIILFNSKIGEMFKIVLPSTKYACQGVATITTIKFLSHLTRTQTNGYDADLQVFNAIMIF